MQKAVTFLLGRAGTGKSEAIFDALKAHRDRGERACLIVPEQFTFETEQRLTEALGGLLGIEVLSFDRLAERILSLSGGRLPYLSGEGLSMILRRSVLTCRDRLRVFAPVMEKPGFAQKMAALITKFMGAGITPEQLNASLSALEGETLLKEKLSDIAILYREAADFLSAHYLTPDDALNAAAAALPNSFVAGLPVYIDGFEGATHAVYTLTRALMTGAGSLTVALTVDPLPSRDTALFAPDREVLEILTEMARAAGLQVRTRHLLKGPEGPHSLSHLEENLFAQPTQPFSGVAEEIELFTAPSRQQEAEEVADRILLTLKDTGCRYRDIAVLCSDLAAYRLPLMEALTARGIPAFLDLREPVKNHPLCRYLLSALRAAALHFPLSEVLALLKSGFVEVDTESVSIFENYVLRYGIRGGQLTAPFTLGKEIPPEAEAVRAQAMAILEPLHRGLAAPLVKDKVLAVYTFLSDPQVARVLETGAQQRLSEGRMSLLQASAQVWNRIMALLDQAVAILGEERISREDFASLMEEGFANMGLGVIPALSDGVLVGQADKTRTRPCDHLFLLGVNEGLLPKAFSDDGLLDDREIAAMKTAGVSGLKGTEADLALEDKKLYQALTRARARLTLSCALTAEGTEQLPSPLYFKMDRLFPNRSEANLAFPQSLESAKFRLAQALSTWKAGEVPDPLLPSLKNVLSRGDTVPLVAAMEEAAKNDPSLPRLSPGAAKALYERESRMSASRLESYNRCPFQHFAAYGLGLKERRVAGEEAADLGSLYHAALDGFVTHCIREKINWQTLSDEDCGAILSAILPPILAEHNDGFYVLNDRARGTLPLIYDTLHRAVRAIRDHLAAGQFAPAGAELRFGPGCAFPPIRLTLPGGRVLELTGVIDRLDAAPGPEGDYLRIIDYKTGGRRFSFGDVYQGYALQLPLYMEAVCAAGAAAGGMYYMPISVPLPEEGPEAEEALKKAFLLRGLTLADEALVEKTDTFTDSSSVVGGLKHTKNGLSGALCDPAQMDQLITAARHIAEKTAQQLLDGGILARPVKDACDYCRYRACCRFDPALPGCRFQKRDKLSAWEFFELIGGTAHGLDQ
ncbi:MAG: exodeoxyribonuclease V subunit gamma [Clostridia bacterium]|nr:exodeoxyribonuclease V subunit gamma [Clostridia bacterium]